MRQLLNVYRGIVSGLSSLRSPMLLAVRLYWGFQFAQTGWGKLHDLAKITGFFGSLNIPAPRLAAPAISLLEFAGGILLMLGLFSRASRISPRLQHVRRILDSRPRSAHLGLFRPGQVLYRRSVYLPLRIVDGLILGAGFWAVDTLIAKRVRALSSDRA